MTQSVLRQASPALLSPLRPQLISAGREHPVPIGLFFENHGRQLTRRFCPRFRNFYVGILPLPLSTSHRRVQSTNLILPVERATLVLGHSTPRCLLRRLSSTALGCRRSRFPRIRPPQTPTFTEAMERTRGDFVTRFRIIFRMITRHDQCRKYLFGSCSWVDKHSYEEFVQSFSFGRQPRHRKTAHSCTSTT